mmetsp:Transcript_21969/g.51848  ORF Transcript_21969/g.51848 Transcript_21969/m.51848 type:complete len:338 (+) Transcript_21969:414-1427(+)
MSTYTPAALVRAGAPLKVAIDALISESSNRNDESFEVQAKFVATILEIAGYERANERTLDWRSVSFIPSGQYVQKLVQRFCSQLLEQRGSDVEDDDLASLIYHFSATKSRGSLPDPSSPNFLTFCIDENNAGPLRIRTFPQHNDVGCSKIWEAGAALAEFLIHNSDLVRNKDVVEFGSGVGFTGLVVAGVSRVTSIHMTDYTSATLENLAFNVELQRDWLIARGVEPKSVTLGMLEWESYSENIGDPISAEGKRTWPWSGSFEALTKANLLLAADVVYDPNFIGALVRAVVKFFKLGTGLEGTERTAIFAPRIGTEQHSACSKMNSSSTRSRQCITF